MTRPDLVFAVSAALIFHAYAGYPLLLAVVTRIRSRWPRRRGESGNRDPDWPRVSVMLPAHDEAAVIGARLDNLLALNYPADRLEVIVGSDASTDGTADVARRREDSRISVVDSRARRGKTALLNDMVALSTGEVIAFTDANCAWNRDALRHLVAPLAADDVGCVIGELRYVNLDQPTVRSGEGLYWRYENAIKEMESSLRGTLVANGSIYALRRGLCRTLPAEISDDSANPLLVLRDGFRVVFERRAVARENAAASLTEEFHRKARMVTRQLGSHRLVRAFLWPPRPGLAFRLASHKLLRWLVPVLAAVCLLIAASQAARPFYGAVLVLAAAGATAAGVGGLLLARGRGLSRWWRLWVYLWMVNLAALRGLYDFIIGRRRAVWRVSQSTRRGLRP
ncbi:MAG: glycosyltransferase family 2 protein [Acidobacteriota bacterium]